MSERKKEFKTTSQIELKRIYRADDLSQSDAGDSGEFPFTRGIQPHMYRSRFWTMRQYAGYGSAAESNRRFKFLLSQGQTGLSVAFDLPTQIGMDSDHPMAAGEVGKVGVAIDSLRDMELLFDGIPLDRVSTSMTINSTAAILLALYIAVGRKQGVPAEKLSGTVQNDILKEYIARGTYIYPPHHCLRIITNIFEYCSHHLPEWNTISISGYHIREAGSSAVQEVAFTLMNGVTYVSAALNAGLKVDDFAPRLSFFFNAHNNLFEEVAKFRAARRMWARLMRERFHATNERSCMLRFHAQTSGATLTAQQPDVNVVRVTLQALAAVLGGTQSLHTNSRDEALALPTQEAALLALRTQQVIAHESGVADVVDPLGGSYFLESMTDEIERRAQQYIDQIEKLGGMLRAIESGFVQKEIQESAYQYQRAIEKKEQIVVGMNSFVAEQEAPIPILRVDPALEEEQKKKVAAVRAERDAKKAATALASVEAAARNPNENLMPHILNAVEAYCTVGEISDALRKVFGEYREAVTV